eukprot:252546-Prymnesium_polylepis.1
MAGDCAALSACSGERQRRSASGEAVEAGELAAKRPKSDERKLVPQHPEGSKFGREGAARLLFHQSSLGMLAWLDASTPS